MTQTINIADIRTNGGTQSRAAINLDVVADYAEALAAGATFPPLTAFFDGTAYWLADGFHRYEAYSRAGVYEVPTDVRQGTQRQAVLFSVGANASHGLRRTNEDKRRAVLTLLNDPEWAAWSDREIARQCGVGNKFVGDVRKSICVPNTDSAERTVTRKGTTYQQNTAHIGERQSIREAPAPVATAPVEARAPSADPAPPTPAPAHDADWREIARLTPEAMIAEIIGLRADLAERKAQSDALRRERDDLKARLKEATADDQGAVIGSLQKQLQAAKFARDEAMAATKRMERRLKTAEARVKELESMEVTF